MPTVLFINGFRFFFYSNENDEPIHIHVKKGNAEGKIWLEPQCAIAYLRGFTNAEEKNIIEIVQDNLELLKMKWNEYFNK
jgi:hypothetical protein